MLPSKRALEKGDAPKYSASSSGAVYGISIAVLIMALAYIFITYRNSNSLSPMAVINGILFLIVGIGLIAANRSVINAIKIRAMDNMQQSTPLPAQEPDTPEVIPGHSSTVQPGSARARAQTGSAEDIQVSVRLPISGQQGTARQQQYAQAPRKPVKLACPKCRNIIIIDTAQRTGVIQCNYCGFTGKIG